MAHNSHSGQKADKNSFSQGKHRRLSDAVETNLSAITGSDERTKLMKTLSKNGLEIKNQDEWSERKIEPSLREDGDEKPRNNKTKHEETSKQNILNNQIVNYTGKVQNRKMCHGYEPECEGLFEEELKTAEVSENSNVDQVNKKQGNKIGVQCEKSINSSLFVPKLDLSSLDSDTDSSNTKHVDGLENKHLKSNEFSDMKDSLEHTCTHGNINFTPRVGQSLYHDVSQGRKNKTPRKCILCDINGASVKTKVPKDYDELLTEIIYPHDYYDRYSRAGKKTHETKQKEVISICKPVKVLPKPKPPQYRTSPMLSAPTTTPEIMERVDQEGTQEIRKIKSGEIEDETKTEEPKKYLYEPRETMKTEFHEHCGNKAFVIIEHTEHPKRCLKGMKGCQMHRDAKNSPKDVKRSEYSISSLGMQFSLPDYNASLSSRKDPVTQPARYPVKHSDPYSPLAFGTSRQHHMTCTPRPTKTLPKDDQVSGQTVSLRSVEDIVKSFDTQRGRLNTDGVSEMSTHKLKVRISSEEETSTKSELNLPPIPLEVRSSSFRAALMQSSAPITLAGITLL